MVKSITIHKVPFFCLSLRFLISKALNILSKVSAETLLSHQLADFWAFTIFS